MDKIALDKLNAGSEDDFVRALGDIFEHTPGIARAVYKGRQAPLAHPPDQEFRQSSFIPGYTGDCEHGLS